MITYLLKSAMCLALLLGFYHLVLEREKMHRFNRFYLLSAVFVSFLAPLYTIYTKVIQEPIAVFTQLPDENITFTQKVVATETPINYWNYAIYFSVFISAILLMRFLKNLYVIYKKVSISEKFKHQNATIVLVVDEILPHTFWNYIFINKATYESKEVEQELFTHELTHVAQKHTFDVLFVELLKVVFWFNPIFYFLKKSVQLNHEFLADTKVVTQHKNVSKYQHLLINTSAWSNEYALASNLHYLVTKKRIIMMTKQTSKAVILLKKITVLPLVIGTFFLFAERVEAQESVETIVEDVPFNSVKTEDFDLYKEYYYKKLTFIRKDKNGNKVSKKYNELSKEEKQRLAPPPALNQKEKTPSKELIENLKDNKKYALWIDGKVVKNTDLSNYKNIDFSNYFVSFVYKNARSKRFPQEYQANLSTKKYFKTQNKKRKEAFLNWVKKEHNIEEIKIGKENYIDSPIKRKSSKQSIASESVLEDIRKKLNNADALKISLTNKDSIIFKKDWFITIDNQKYYYTFNKNERVARYYKNGKLVNLNIIKEYNKKHKKFEGLKSSGKHYVFKSENKKQEIDREFSDLGGMYFRMSRAEKNKVPYPRNPIKPYVRLRKGDKIWYKKLNELTSEDKLLLPPPPPIPNASKEEILKAKKAYDNWKKRTGNDLPPPPKPAITKIVRKGDTKITGSSTSKNGIEKGWKQVGDKTLYYVKENGKTLYFNRYGKSVNSKGKEIKQTINIDKIKNLSNREISELKYETNNKNVTYYLNKKIISKKEIHKLDPKQIDKMSVKKNKDGSGSIYVTTKN